MELGRRSPCTLSFKFQARKLKVGPSFQPPISDQSFIQSAEASNCFHSKASSSLVRWNSNVRSKGNPPVQRCLHSQKKRRVLFRTISLTTFARGKMLEYYWNGESTRQEKTLLSQPLPPTAVDRIGGDHPNALFTLCKVGRLCLMKPSRP